MSPVGKSGEMAIDVEVVEAVPCPHRIPVLIQIDECISRDLNRPRVSGKVGKRLVEYHEHDQMPVVERQNIVMKTLRRETESGSKNLLAQGASINLPDGIAG